MAIWVLASLPWLLLPVSVFATWKWATEHKLQAGDVKYVKPVRIEIAVAEVVAKGIADALRAVTGVGQPADVESVIVPGEDAYAGIGMEQEARWEQLLGDVTDADLGPELKWEVPDGGARSGWVGRD